MRRLHWLLPSRISGQIAIVIAVSLVMIHSIVTFGFFSGDHHGRGPPGRPEPLVLMPMLISLTRGRAQTPLSALQVARSTKR
jgi:hypothetical protein